MKYLFVFIFTLLSFCFSSAQELFDTAEPELFFDALVFKSDSINDGRLDVFIVAPYQLLEFKNNNEKYSASYNLIIKILDSNKNQVDIKQYFSIVNAKDYAVSKGSQGGFENWQSVFYLRSGKYKVEALLIDNYSKREFLVSRSVNILNYNSFNFSTSALMLLSSIEERNNKFSITPYISDNIGGLTDGFFVFFEVYNKNIGDSKFSISDSSSHNLKRPDSVLFVCEISDVNGNPVYTGKRILKSVSDPINRIFLKIPFLSELISGQYILRVYALKKDAPSKPESDNFLAAAERSVTVSQTIMGKILKNLNDAISQLRYVANSVDMDIINSANTSDEKLKRFVEFWKKLDPTPDTERNEAFDEYYKRIYNANRLYKSYSAGWLTDRGMVYIIYGPPASTELSQNIQNTSKYERWLYSDNREFIFYDRTGFGDYQLYKPFAVSDKYVYGR
ncbi:MAG: GWxTD domain-containing protein [Candidatus Kapabacteria bacterium]|nr:GWxTD domain-containing protein [Candidatus Kapabacteria bacterium]